MKKFITLLFSAGLVTAAFAQTGDHRRNDTRSSDNNNPSSSYSDNTPSGYPGQYSEQDAYNGNSEWNQRGSDNQFARSRERKARQRYEMMMMRNQKLYYHQRRNDNYSPYSRNDNYSPYAPARKSVLQIRIGIGNRSTY